MPDADDGRVPAHHWDDVYRSRDADDVSWFQAVPAMSMRLLSDLDRRPTSLIDIGAGASRLVDALLDEGIEDVTLLDVSDEAMATVRDRLASRNHRVAFIVADVLTWAPRRQWDVWHDRAVFHFLITPQDRARYVTAAAASVPTGGVAVIGCFGLDGPASCSGLPTARYDADGLADQFREHFVAERTEREVHRTPRGADQPFIWVVLRRR